MAELVKLHIYSMYAILTIKINNVLQNYYLNKVSITEQGKSSVKFNENKIFSSEKISCIRNIFILTRKTQLN